MSTNEIQSLVFDGFTEFKNWKETLKTDRGLQFSFQWSRVKRNGSQHWRYICRHIKAQSNSSSDVASMMVAFEADGKIKVELCAPHCHEESSEDETSPTNEGNAIKRIHIEEPQTSTEKPIVENNESCTIPPAADEANVLVEGSPERDENAENCENRIHWVKKLVRIEESKESKTNEKPTAAVEIKHARPWENSSGASCRTASGASVERNTEINKDHHVENQRDAKVQQVERSDKKSFENPKKSVDQFNVLPE